jgi:hypothetical protein
MQFKTSPILLTALSPRAHHSVDLRNHSPEHSLLPTVQVEADKAENKPPSPPTKSWTPLMLQRRVLVTISIALLFLIVSLEIVLKISANRNGFGPIESDLHYLWTYGPTAGIVIQS